MSGSLFSFSSCSYDFSLVSFSVWYCWPVRADAFPALILSKAFTLAGYLLHAKTRTADPLAQLVERRTAVRVVSGSSPRPDQHSGS